MTRAIRQSQVFGVLLAICGSSAGAAERVLLIGVESIPYTAVVAVMDPNREQSPLFQGFKGPAEVINAFPAMSYAAWTELLAPMGVQAAPGYIGRHFDTETGAVRSQAWGAPLPWADFFDWRLTGITRKAFAYGSSRSYSVKELRRALTAFAKSDAPVFGIYLISPDGIGHIHGPNAIVDFLRRLDAALVEFKRTHEDLAFRTVIVSDHGAAGGRPLVNVWPDVKRQVKAAGFNVSYRIHNDKSVVFVPYGLLSAFTLNTAPGIEREVVAAFIDHPGIALCAIRDGAGWRVMSDGGEALIARRASAGGTQWSYAVDDGDPLGYLPFATKLAHGHADESGWHDDRAWFAASVDHRYPDALRRIARSFELVENPASAVCSNEAGFVFGAVRTEIAAAPTIGRLKWSHGALDRESSSGMLISDLPEWGAPDVVRAGDALEFLADRWRAAAVAVP